MIVYRSTAKTFPPTGVVLRAANEKNVLIGLSQQIDEL